MHTQHLERRATVCFASKASNTNAAIEVWFNRATVPRFDSEVVACDLQHLCSKLVPQNARVTKEGLTAAECMLVGATHPDPAHPHERLAFARRPRKTHIDYAELTRFI